LNESQTNTFVNRVAIAGRPVTSALSTKESKTIRSHPNGLSVSRNYSGEDRFDRKQSLRRLETNTSINRVAIAGRPVTSALSTTEGKTIRSYPNGLSAYPQLLKRSLRRLETTLDVISELLHPTLKAIVTNKNYSKSMLI
jgi:hypothetical protein